jgi:hypothetical protein
MPVERPGDNGRSEFGPTVVVGDAEDNVEEVAENVEDTDVLDIRPTNCMTVSDTPGNLRITALTYIYT